MLREADEIVHEFSWYTHYAVCTSRRLPSSRMVQQYWWRLLRTPCTFPDLRWSHAICDSVGPLFTVVFTGCGMVVEVLFCKVKSGMTWRHSSPMAFRSREKPLAPGPLNLNPSRLPAPRVDRVSRIRLLGARMNRRRPVLSYSTWLFASGKPPRDLSVLNLSLCHDGMIVSIALHPFV